MDDENIIEIGGVRYMHTSVVRVETPATVHVWTPIPAGMTPMDLGRRFHAARVVTDPWGDTHTIVGKSGATFIIED